MNLKIYKYIKNNIREIIDKLNNIDIYYNISNNIIKNENRKY